MRDIVFTPSWAGHENAGGTERLQEFLGYCDERKLTGDGGWTCKKTAQRGDLYLFWFGEPASELVGFGVHTGIVNAEDNVGVDWTKAPTLWLGNFAPLHRFRRPLTKAEIQDHPVLARWWNTKPYQGGPKTVLKTPDAAAMLLKTLITKNPGAKRYLAPFLGRTKEIAGPSRGSKRRTETRDGEHVRRRLAASIASLEAEDRERVFAMIRRVVRDRRLRGVALGAWGEACVLCGLRLEAGPGVLECEIAHIEEVRTQGKDRPRNAIPLCRTHHWAFDQYLWGIDPRSNRAVVVPALRKHSVFKGVHGKRIRGRSKITLHSGAVRARWSIFLSEQKRGRLEESRA